eukprot:SAG11_NODE_15311_length_582_cov_0.877847_1_plen_71_part_01
MELQPGDLDLAAIGRKRHSQATRTPQRKRKIAVKVAKGMAIAPIILVSKTGKLVFIPAKLAYRGLRKMKPK